MLNENKGGKIPISKDIMEFYTVEVKDSFFTNGNPKVETVEVVENDCSWPKTYAKVALSIENTIRHLLFRDWLRQLPKEG